SRAGARASGSRLSLPPPLARGPRPPSPPPLRLRLLLDRARARGAATRSGLNQPRSPARASSRRLARLAGLELLLLGHEPQLGGLDRDGIGNGYGAEGEMLVE